MIIKNNYIIAIEPTDEHYAAIKEMIDHKPVDPEGYQYCINYTTLEWELVELPPKPDPGDEEAGEEDYQQVLDDLGVRLS